MPLTAAEKQKLYRQRLKNNHEKNNIQKEKARARYHKTKHLIKEKSVREQRVTRRKWRKYKAEERIRNDRLFAVLNDTPPSSPGPLPPQHEPVPSPSNLARGRKKLRRDRTKLYRDNLAILEKNKKLEVKAEKYKKRYQRLMKKHKYENSDLLVDKTDSLLSNCLSSPTSSRTKKLRPILLKYFVLTDALKQKYQKNSNRASRSDIKSLCLQNILKKYRLSLSAGSDFLGLKSVPRIRQSIRKNEKLKNMRDNVKNFFLRDDVSRATAGKKETKTKLKNKVQKRYLLDTQLSLHKKYIAEFEKCSYSFFTQNRPFYVVNPSINTRETCACKKHINLQLKLDALKKVNALSTNDIVVLVKSIVCDSHKKDCMYNICVICKDKSLIVEIENDCDDMEWYEWVRIAETYEKNGKITQVFKTTKKKFNENKNTLLRKLKEEMIFMKKHIFNIKTQYLAYRTCVDNVNEHSASLHIDFSENYNCKFAEEIQAHHFGGSRKQITIHTGVLYIAKEEPISFATISSNNDHGPSAIWAHLTPIFRMIKEKNENVKTIHFFSDGPATQYRQKQNFFLFSHKLFDYGFQQGTWSFFESGHGKGAADGIGGVLKRTADRLVAHGKDIYNADTFVELVQKETAIKLFIITPEDISTMATFIPQYIPILKGTMNLHQLILREKGVIEYRDISCFCDVFSSLGRGFCKCFKPKIYSTSTLDMNTRHSVYNLIYSPNNSNDEDESNITSFNTDIDINIDQQMVGKHLLINITFNKKKNQMNYRYVAVAQTEIDDEGEIKVIYLKSVDNKKTIYKIEDSDIVDVHSKEILQILPNPSIRMKGSRVLYQFSTPIDIHEKI